MLALKLLQPIWVPPTVVPLSRSTLGGTVGRSASTPANGTAGRTHPSPQQAFKNFKNFKNTLAKAKDLIIESDGSAVCVHVQCRLSDLHFIYQLQRSH
jgi:hypothetical protein